MTPDAMTLLRELRPDDDYTPPELALDPQPSQRRRQRLVRPLAAAAAIAALALVALALAPQSRDSPSVLARAAAALSEPGTILHFKAVVVFNGGKPQTIESWQTTSGRQERTIFGVSGLESVEDQDAKTFQTYNPERDELLNHTDPDYFDDRHATPPGLAGGGPGIITVVGDLRALLQRAADGKDANVHLLDDTVVRGIAVHHLRITREMQAIVDSGAPRTVTTVRDVYISAQDDLPVRVVDHLEVHGPLPNSEVSYDFEVAEHLPLDARLLRMAPHPGAKITEEGKVR